MKFPATLHELRTVEPLDLKLFDTGIGGVFFFSIIGLLFVSFMSLSWKCLSTTVRDITISKILTLHVSSCEDHIIRIYERNMLTMYKISWKVWFISCGFSRDFFRYYYALDVMSLKQKLIFSGQNMFYITLLLLQSSPLIFFSSLLELFHHMMQIAIHWNQGFLKKRKKKRKKENGIKKMLLEIFIQIQHGHLWGFAWSIGFFMHKLTEHLYFSTWLKHVQTTSETLRGKKRRKFWWNIFEVFLIRILSSINIFVP